MKNTMTISKTDKAYFCRLNRNLVFGELIRYFRRKAKEDGLTQKHLGNLLQMDYGRLSRLLSEPSNLTLDSVSELLLGMNAQMKFKVLPMAKAATMDEFMDEFESWSQRNQAPISGSKIIEFNDQSPKVGKGTASATNNPALVRRFGDSGAKQATG